MDREDQLAWERRLARPAAAAAIVSALLLVVSTAVQLSASGSRRGNEGTRYKRFLSDFHDHAGAILVSTIGQAIAGFLFAAAMAYLFHATRHRRPEAPAWVLPLIALAPVLLAIGAVIGHVHLQDVANKFAASPGPPSKQNQHAKDLLEGRSQLGGGIGLAGGLAVAISTVLVSMNAMRTGLLSRFMGVLGVIVGVLFVLPLLPGVPVVQVFWVAALAALFLGYWPGGRGPAWDSGEAEPWPSAAQERLAAREAGAPEPEPGIEEPAPNPRRSKKRKRKRGR